MNPGRERFLQAIARIVVLVFVATALFGQTGEGEKGDEKPVTLNSLRFAFDVRRAELMQPLKELDAFYRQQLEKLREEVQRAAQLENVIAVDAELAVLQGRVPEAAGEPFAKLDQLRSIYQREKTERFRKSQQALLALIGQEKARLEALRTELTKKGEIDEAIKARDELKKLTDLETQTTETIEALKNGGDLSSPAPGSLAGGLLVHFDFDRRPRNGLVEGASGTSFKAATSAEDGPAWTGKGHLGGAFAFDGVDDRLELTEVLPDMERMTVAAWIFYESPAPGHGLVFSDFDGKNGNDLMFGLAGKSEVFIRADKTPGHSLKDRISVSADFSGKWHHLAWVLEPRRSIVYVDGEHAGDTAKPGSNIGSHRAFIGFGSDSTDWTY
ncbi:MAG: hypothetical protein KDM91_20965, partial [Verrucomicrobiae bacterium]|nr:hypothetical protein [Verrucomicrobiae bacterium]